jgi:hypothetical protein
VAQIQKQIAASPDMRDKRELIEKFIDRMTPEKGNDVYDDWEKYVEEEKRKELESIIKEENPKAAETEDFIERAFSDGYVTETGTGITKFTETYKDSWHIGSTSDEAILKAIEQAKGRMAKFVDDNFKVEAVIKALDQVDPKKGVKTCYITIGSAAGIDKGQIFEVFIEAEVAGEKIQKKIGEVRAKEVMSAKLTLCDVKSGGMEIKENFEKNVRMTVISRAKKPGLGGILSL